MISTKVSNAGPDSFETRYARRGRAAAGGLFALVLLLGLGGALAAWFAWDVRGDEGGEALAPEIATSGAAAAAADASAADTAQTPESSSKRSDVSEPRPLQPIPRPEPGDAPLGRIQGEVHTGPGGELPELWYAIAEPSSVYQGSHAGVRRKVEVNGGNRFVIDELPLAGYAVSVEAAGYNSLPVPVLLTPGSETQIVNLTLSPSGFLDGFVRDVEGVVIEGLTVTLEAEHDRSRRSVSTQVDGSFLFPDVLDGNYRVFFGSPEAPLVEPTSIAFKAPSLRLPEVELPRLGKLIVHTFDRDGTPLGEVRVRGFGSSGSPVETLTDERGKASIGHLLPGSYRLFASTEDGRETRSRVSVELGEDTRVELRLHPE